jgi:hypothetical protein
MSLAPSIRSFHGSRPHTLARGTFRVVRGPGRIAAVLASALRLPPANPATELRLQIVADGAGERWQRDFGGQRLDTTQEPSDDGRALREQFGPLEFTFALHVLAGSLVHVQRATALVVGPVRFPLPAWSAPRIVAREDPAGDHVRVEVRIQAPGVGMLVSYDGVVTVDTSTFAEGPVDARAATPASGCAAIT